VEFRSLCGSQQPYIRKDLFKVECEVAQ
jgi:hypothetical protein